MLLYIPRTQCIRRDTLDQVIVQYNHSTQRTWPYVAGTPSGTVRHCFSESDSLNIAYRTPLKLGIPCIYKWDYISLCAVNSKARPPTGPTWACNIDIKVISLERFRERMMMQE